VCLRDVQLPSDAREGDIVVCPFCKIEFRLVLVNGEWQGTRVSKVA
jgi:hypothetical protein